MHLTTSLRKAKERVKAEDLAFGAEETTDDEVKPAEDIKAKPTDERSLLNPATTILTTLFLGAVAVFFDPIHHSPSPPA